MMSYKEMQDLLEHNAEKQNDVRVPNEIFADLVSCELLQVDKGFGKANHIAFAFSYYYLISYLYRECKFNLKYPINTKIIKRILGYSENNKRLDYIIKKGGVLDQMWYTETTYNYPVYWYFEDSPYFVEFVTYNDYTKEEHEENKDYFLQRLQIKKPLKAFWKDEETKTENISDGTFYDWNDTTMIPFDVFMFCMTKEDLGVKGFFLYSFIRYKSDYYGGSFDMPFPTLAKSVGFSESTLTRTLKTLEQYNIISNSHNPFILDRPADKKTDANRYSCGDRVCFEDVKREKIRTRQVMTNERHDELLAGLDDLPF
jgi:hypothetical protein